MMYEEFVKFAEQLVNLSSRIGDEWKLEGNQKSPGLAYLVKRFVLTLKQAEHNESVRQTYDDLEDFEESVSSSCEDHSTVTITALPRILTCEYHIVYSASYNSPVLYFNVWNSDGNLLTLDEIWSSVVSTLHLRLKSQTWNFLTQQEHPILRRPFFQIHPCFTPELLGQLSKPSNNTLVTWLSSVGPIVGLKLPPDYAALT